jgi:hypothetical protein
VGDAKSSLSDAKSSLSDTKSSLSDAPISLVEQVGPLLRGRADEWTHPVTDAAMPPPAEKVKRWEVMWAVDEWDKRYLVLEQRRSAIRSFLVHGAQVCGLCLSPWLKHQQSVFVEGVHLARSSHALSLCRSPSLQTAAAGDATVLEQCMESLDAANTLEAVNDVETKFRLYCPDIIHSIQQVRFWPQRFFNQR